MAQHDRAFTDTRQGAQGGLDLAGFDAVSAQLDLMVHAADEFYRSVLAPAGQIARGVEPPTVRAEGIGNEALGGGAGPVHITAGNAVAADIEFPRTPIGTGLRSGSST